MRRVVVYGASGQARSIADFVIGRDGERFVAYIDDFAEPGLIVDDCPVLSMAEYCASYLDADVMLGTGSPPGKRQMAARIDAAGGHFREGGLDRNARLGRDSSLGLGTYLGFGTYVGPGTAIGNHVSVMTNCSIGHDTAIGHFSTVCPSATVSGNVVLEDGVFVGAGAVVVNGARNRPLVIGANTMIAAGAVVTKSLPAGSRVVGNPARPIRDLVKSLR